MFSTRNWRTARKLPADGRWPRRGAIWKTGHPWVTDGQRHRPRPSCGPVVGNTGACRSKRSRAFATRVGHYGEVCGTIFLPLRLSRVGGVRNGQQEKGSGKNAKVRKARHGATQRHRDAEMLPRPRIRCPRCPSVLWAGSPTVGHRRCAHTSVASKTKAHGYHP
jgi:hypothetical protein